MTYTAEQIEAIGGKSWTSPDQKVTRVYLRGAALAKLIGLEIDYYKTGNISFAALRGEKISNAEAKRLADSAVFWQDGILSAQTASRDGDALVDAVIAALAAIETSTEPAAVEQVELHNVAPAPARPITSGTAMVYLLSIGRLAEMRSNRGPRWFISARVRAREYCGGYADTAEQAEQRRAWLDNEGYQQIQVEAPHGSVDLGALGRVRADAKRAYDEATAILRAGVLRALEERREETEIARTAGVDRQTVRAWAGKQPMNRG